MTAGRLRRRGFGFKIRRLRRHVDVDAHRLGRRLQVDGREPWRRRKAEPSRRTADDRIFDRRVDQGSLDRGVWSATVLSPSLFHGTLELQALVLFAPRELGREPFRAHPCS